MKIAPVYTLSINDGEYYINETSEVKVKMNHEKEYKGIFLNCDSSGIEVETGEEESNVVYLLYDEIESIEEV
jgi:hypothetical protein